MYIKLETASPISNTVVNYKSSEMCFPIFSFTRTILFAHCTTSGENTRGIQESNDNAPATVCRGTNGFGLQARRRRDGASRGASPVLCPVQKIEVACGPN